MSNWYHNLPTPDWVSPCGNAVLYNRDCLEVLPLIPAGSVDAVVTDPPYGMSFQSARRIESERFDKIANDSKPFIWWICPTFKAVRDDGCVLTFCRWDDAEAFRLALDWGGFAVKSQLIWDRGNHGLGDLKGTPAPRHDTVWFAVKGKFQFHGRRPPSVLSHMRLGGEQLRHPNEKPESLLVELVQDYTPPMGVVLDPFVGSGTTGAASIMQGRRFIGCELSEEYFAIACERIANEHERFALFNGADKESQGQLFKEAAP